MSVVVLAALKLIAVVAGTAAFGVAVARLKGPLC